MRALAMTRPEPGALELIELKRPTAGADQVLVRVEACGICSTDVAIYNWRYHGRRPVRIPNVLGHEIAGVVEEVGPAVSDLKPGERVTLEAFWPCESCRECQQGRPNICVNWWHVGACEVGGGFAEFLVAPARRVHRVPPELDPADVALLEPLTIAVHGLEIASPVPGQSAVIVGPGPLGLLHLAALKLAGVSRTVVFGRPRFDERRLELARTLGATTVAASGGEAARQVARETLGPDGADIVVEAGGTPESFELALDLAAPGGIVLIVGFALNAQIQPLPHLIRKYLRLSSVSASRPEHYARAISWVEQGLVLPSAIVTHRLELDMGSEAFSLLERGEAGKVLILPSATSG